MSSLQRIVATAGYIFTVLLCVQLMSLAGFELEKPGAFIIALVSGYIAGITTSHWTEK